MNGLLKQLDTFLFIFFKHIKRTIAPPLVPYGTFRALRESGEADQAVVERVTHALRHTDTFFRPESPDVQTGVVFRTFEFDPPQEAVPV